MAARLALGLALVVLLSGGVGAQELPDGAQPVQYRTGDGLQVHGELLGHPQDERPLILLFHQGGGDARGEYAPILPRLLGEGYAAMIVDQRRGGRVFGGENRTAAGTDREWEFCDAYPEIEGALRHARERGFAGPIVAWGSSYSGTLALNLALDHPDELAAVLGFSPASGGPLQPCAAEPRAEQMTVPTLILRPVGETERESVRTQLQVWEAAGHRTWVADPGVHGSSMLVAGRVGAPTDETWQVVLDFLDATLGRD